MEFQRSVLADCGRIYNSLLQHEIWDEAAQALGSGPLAYRPRALARSLQILTHIMNLSRLDRDNALSLLKTYTKYDLPNRFWQHVEPLPDPIICDLVVAGVTVEVDQRCTVADSCRKESATCHLPDFLAHHSVELQAVVDYLEAHPQVVKGQLRVERLVRRVIDDSRAALGQSTCWPLGDVIIALQAIPVGQIWSLDADFAPLAQTLGLTLHAPTLSE